MLMQLLNNHPLMAALCASVIAQVLKVIIEFATDRRLDLRRLLDTGGMPSAHSAAVSALACGMGLEFGFASPLFAITAVFGYLVMYDATGIRRAAGVQAQLINELVDELNHLFNDGFQPQVLKTLLGHTYPQVGVGLVLGILTGILVHTFA